MFDLGKAYICSKCGTIVMGAGAKKTNDLEIRICPLCDGEILDTGYDFGDYSTKNTEWLNQGKDLKKHLVETIAIPYGKYDPNCKKRPPAGEGVDFSFALKGGVKCPYCKSSSVSKISTASRVISTGFFGLASKKIGKQWHCSKCGSDF